MSIPFASIWEFIKSLDWILFMLLLVAVGKFAASAFLFWRQTWYKCKMQWILMEIKIPRETLRGPKAMEQFFAGISRVANYRDGYKEFWLDGEVTRWFSFEIVGSNQTTRFYLRCIESFKQGFLSNLYAQYPEIEIVKADHDYIEDMPATYQELKKQNYEMYNLEVTQAKPVPYMFNTYVDFEPEVGNEKGRILDSMATTMEIMGRLKPQETIWAQFLCQADVMMPWWSEADAIINKMKNATQKADSGGEEPLFRIRFRTQHEEKTLKRLDEKKGKANFNVTFRSIYMAPKSVYNQDTMNRGLYAALAQFSNDEQKIMKLNKVRSKVDWDAPPFIFPKTRLFWKRVINYDEYRRRFIPEETFAGKLYWSKIPFRWCFFHKPMVLSAEEIATFFHIPTNIVLTQTTMERIESKRLTAPSNLPG